MTRFQSVFCLRFLSHLINLLRFLNHSINAVNLVLDKLPLICYHTFNEGKQKSLILTSGFLKNLKFRSYWKPFWKNGFVLIEEHVVNDNRRLDHVNDEIPVGFFLALFKPANQFVLLLTLLALFTHGYHLLKRGSRLFMNQTNALIIKHSIDVVNLVLDK